jgi:hypothetical protein
MDTARIMTVGRGRFNLSHDSVAGPKAPGNLNDRLIALKDGTMIVLRVSYSLGVRAGARAHEGGKGKRRISPLPAAPGFASSELGCPGEAPVPRLPTTRPHHLSWWADTPSCTTVEPEHEVNRAATGRARLRLDRLRAAGSARRGPRRPRPSLG